MKQVVSFIFFLVCAYMVIVFIWTTAFVVIQAFKPTPKSKLEIEFNDLKLEAHAVKSLAPLFWICDRSFKPWHKRIKEIEQKRIKYVELIKALEHL
jgi:hypothetical protein